MHKLTGFKILVVEDDPDLNEIICDFLNSENAVTTSATNGHNALEILKEQKVDFILSDIQMPIMDGFEMITRLLSSGTAQPPILFATGQSKLTEAAAQRIGATGLIYKPFSKDALIQTIVKILKDSGLEKLGA